MNAEASGIVKLELKVKEEEKEEEKDESFEMRVELKESEDEEDEKEGKNSAEANNGRWTKAEHKLFLEALGLYGKDWKKVQKYVGTRTTTQARSHAQKYFGKLEREGKKSNDSKDGELSYTIKQKLCIRKRTVLHCKTQSQKENCILAS